MTSSTAGRKYRVVRYVGEGSSGVVYKAQDISTGEYVALKMLIREFDSWKLLRLKREYRILKTLNHPHIVSVKRFETIGDASGIARPTIVMEFIEGADLDRHLAYMGRSADKEELEEAVSIVKQIASALQYLHEKGMIHRDIKPSNIKVVRGSGFCKIIDFGLIKAEKTVTEEGTSLGTWKYMSPEQISGRRVDRRSDLYSLGVVFYELICGPFQNIPALTDNTAYPSSVNENIFKRYRFSIDSVLMKLLEKEPEKRFSGAGELLKELEELETSTGSLKLREPDFIGRKKEFTELYNIVLEKSGEAGVHFVILAGAAGAGKSSLLRKFKEYISSALDFPIRLAEADATKPYSAFFELFREILPLSGERQEISRSYESLYQDLHYLFPHIFEKGTDQDKQPAGGSRETLTTLLEAVSRHFEERDKSLIYIVDSADEMDEDSRRFFQKLQEQLIKGAASPVVFIFALPEASEFESWLKEETSPDALSFLELGGLTDQEITELIKSMLSLNVSPGKNIMMKLKEVSEGLPFYLIEFIKYLYDKGLLTRQEGDWELNLPDDQPLPGKISQLMDAKLNLLNARDLKVLRTASVIGREFTYGLVSRLCRFRDEELSSTLRELNARNFIRYSGEGDGYLFSSEVLRMKLYETLDPDARKQFHTETAFALFEEGEKIKGTKSFQIGRHFEYGIPEKRGIAVDYYYRYGLAASRLAPRTALNAYERAYALFREADLMPEPERELGIKLMINMGALYRRLLNYAGAAGIYAKALQLARNQNDPNRLGHINMNLGIAHWCLNHDYAEALYYFEKSLKHYEESLNHQGILRTALNLTNIQYYSRRYSEAEDLLQNLMQWIDSPEIQSNAEELTAFWNIHGLIRSELGRYEEAVAAFQKALDKSKDASDPTRRAFILSNIAEVRFLQNRHIESKKLYHSAIEQLEKLSVPTPNEKLYLGLNHMKLAEYGIACDLLQKAESSAADSDEQLLIWTKTALSELYLLMNQVEKSRKMIEETLDQSKSLSTQISDFLNPFLIKARLELKNGSPEAALHAWRKAAALNYKYRNVPQNPVLMLSLAAILILQHKLTLSRRILKKIQIPDEKIELLLKKRLLLIKSHPNDPHFVIQRSQDALEILKKFSLPEYEWRFHFALSKAFLELGDNQKAELSRCAAEDALFKISDGFKNEKLAEIYLNDKEKIDLLNSSASFDD